MSASSQANETDLLIEKKKKSYEYNSEQHRQPSRLVWAEASCIRWIYLFFWWWVSPILSISYKRTLNDEDLDELPHNEKCSTLLSKMLTIDPTKKSFWIVIFKVFWKEFLFAGLTLIPYIAARIAQPLLLRQIVLSIENYQNSGFSASFTAGYLYAVALYICALVQATTHHQYFFRCQRAGLCIRNALVSLTYKHLLSVNTASLHQISTAQIINLVASDLTKFDNFMDYFHFLWLPPTEAIIMFLLLSWILGVLPTLFGYIVLLLLIPIQMIVTRKFSSFGQKTAEWADKRIQAFNELVAGCRVIKMYAWEKPMTERVLEKRRNEFASIRCTSYLRGFNMSLVIASNSLVSLAAFGGAWLLGYQLRAVVVFTAFAFFGQLRMTVAYMLPKALEKMKEVQKVMERFAIVMQLQTMPPKQPSSSLNNVETPTQRGAIIIRDASFSWHDRHNCLSSLNINIDPHTFVGIVGPVGAGKSSLLLAILGEMNMISGEVNLNYSSFSYASQSPWIFADTLRSNILFGNPFDEQRYSSVLKACCLDVDLSVFGPSGDLLIIGEKGINLSGGQRARIALARALYADADIYLLDDPLAAVDSRVAKRIYTQCLGPNGLLNKKTRLLVTHQTQYLIDADQVISLEHGCIQTNDIINRLSQNIENKDDSLEKDGDMKTLLDIIQKSNIDTQSIIADETAETGVVRWSVWLKFFTAPPLRWFGLFFFIFSLLLAEAVYDFTNYWLFIWSSQNKVQQRQPIFPSVYLASTLTTTILVIGRACFAFYHMLCGSNNFHNKMVTALANTHLQFFESNPTGRILNRVTKDQHVIDDLLPVTLFDGLQLILMMAGGIVIIGIINPWILLLLIPMIPLCCILCLYYLKCSRQLKRLESISRSPIYNLFESSLDGLVTIRAFNAKDDFIQLLIDKIDANSRSSIIIFGVSHWFGFRVDLMTTLFPFITALLSVVFCRTISSTSVALGVMYALTLTAWFQWGVRQICEAENMMISAERINEYAKLPAEEDNGDGKRLVNISETWPADGVIEFRNYTLCYRSDVGAALRNINIRVESREKVGVIGRTGAGKSSLFQSILRLVDRSCIDGEILIDDVDISRITLRQLRSHFSVIPQQPVLFGETLRFNLDPCNEYSDEECWMALEAVRLKQMALNHPAGLLLPIARAGSNLSIGQAQLICVARAILKKSKILLIDEATANVDIEADGLLQTVIADKFQDRTILTIAHRLSTVANYNRILVLDDGAVLDFDNSAMILNKYG